MRGIKYDGLLLTVPFGDYGFFLIGNRILFFFPPSPQKKWSRGQDGFMYVRGERAATGSFTLKGEYMVQSVRYFTQGFRYEALSCRCKGAISPLL